MQSIAIVNQKGGVGKTTTAVNLAAALGQGGRRVLLLDLDTTNYATRHLGFRPDEGSIAEVLAGEVTLDSVILHTDTLGVDLVPSSLRLRAVTARLESEPARELRLKRALGLLPERYDFALMDCPPVINLVSVNALVAAQRFVVPVTPDPLAVTGLGELLQQVGYLADALEGACAALLGILITKADYRLRLTRDIEAYLRERMGDQVLETVIRVNTRLAEASGHARAIFDYAPGAEGARAYAALAAELLGRLP